MLSPKAKEIFLVGLRSAHSMEVQAREMMERQAERTGDYPDVQAKIREHLDETNAQLRRLEECLETCGESTSTLKDTVESVLGNVMAMGHAAAGDEILKNTFANNAFENFEIAAYKALIALCGPAGAEDARRLLNISLQEELRMADWIAANVEKVTLAYLSMEQRAAA